MTTTPHAPAPLIPRQRRAAHRSSGPLRVLHVTQPVTGGVGQCVADLVAEQTAAGWDPVIACPADLTGSPLAGLPTLAWEATRGPGPSVARETLALRRLIAEVAPDVVHLHSSKAGLAGRLALRGSLPTLFQPHAWSFQAVGGLKGRASLAWERRAARWADVLLCVSEAERLVGEQAGIDGPLVVRPNGVDVVGRRVVPSAELPALRAGLGLRDAPTVVCVGRLAEQKAPEVLLAAWPTVLALVPGAQLVLVGDGPEEQRVRELAAGLPGVVLTGALPDPSAHVAAADVVAVPSRWEAMALVVLEAMASGRSVVATDVGAARENLQAAGAGALVPVDDPTALALALAARLADPRLAADEGARGRLAAELSYDLTTTTAAVRALYPVQVPVLV